MRRLTRRQRSSAIVLAIVALAFLTLDLGGSGLGSAHSGMRGMLGSLYRGTDAVLGPVRRFAEGVPDAGTNKHRIDELRSENAKLRAQLAAQQADRRTSAQLSQLQLAADRTGRSIVAARVIALGPGAGFDWTVTLDVGRDSGIRTGQTVTNGVALVGRVLHADAHTSVVLLAADPGSGVGVRDVRTGEVGVARGRGTDGFTLTPLSPKAVLKVGDHIETGPGASSSFVPGLIVGTVTAVQGAACGTPTATVQTVVSPSAVDLVGVIVADGSGIGRSALAPNTTSGSTGGAANAQAGRSGGHR
jgi:rod shape-determining protein MreC